MDIVMRINDYSSLTRQYIRTSYDKKKTGTIQFRYKYNPVAQYPQSNLLHLLSDRIKRRVQVLSKCALLNQATIADCLHRYKRSKTITKGAKGHAILEQNSETSALIVYPFLSPAPGDSLPPWIGENNSERNR